MRVVDINALRALAPLPRAPVPRPSRPQPRTPQPRWSPQAALRLVNDGAAITDLTIVGDPPVVKTGFSATGGTPVDVTDEVVPVGHSSPDGAFGFDPTTGRWSLTLGTGPFAGRGTYTVTVASGDATYTIDPTCRSQFVRLP